MAHHTGSHEQFIRTKGYTPNHCSHEGHIKSVRTQVHAWIVLSSVVLPAFKKNYPNDGALKFSASVLMASTALGAYGANRPVEGSISLASPWYSPDTVRDSFVRAGSAAGGGASASPFPPLLHAAASLVTSQPDNVAAFVPNLAIPTYTYVPFGGAHSPAGTAPFLIPGA